MCERLVLARSDPSPGKLSDFERRDLGIPPMDDARGRLDSGGQGAESRSARHPATAAMPHQDRIARPAAMPANEPRAKAAGPAPSRTSPGAATAASLIDGSPYIAACRKPVRGSRSTQLTVSKRTPDGCGNPGSAT